MKIYIHTPTRNEDGTLRLDDNGDPIMDVTEQEIETPIPDNVFPLLEEAQPTKADLLKELEELTAKIKALK